MANHKRKVRLDDYEEVYAYLRRAISAKRVVNGNKEAVDAFEQIKSIVNSDEDLCPLNDWIAHYLDYNTWSKCYRAVNQKFHRQSHETKSIMLSKKAYDGLRYYGRLHECTLSESVIALLEHYDPAYIKNADPEYVDEDRPLIHPAADCSFISQIGGKRFVTSMVGPMAIDVQPLDKDPRSKQPAKPKGYDIAHTTAYKKYSAHIKQFKMTKVDPKLQEQYRHVMGDNYVIDPDNMQELADKLKRLQSSLIKTGELSKRFDPEAIKFMRLAKLSERQMQAYGDELLWVICDLYGTDLAEITLGNATPMVLAGNYTNVQICSIVLTDLFVFFKSELDRAFDQCHKNTKRANKYRKAEAHCGWMVTDLSSSISGEDDEYDLYSDREQVKLEDEVRRQIHEFYDENEPIGGWR